MKFFAIKNQLFPINYLKKENKSIMFQSNEKFFQKMRINFDKFFFSEIPSLENSNLVRVIRKISARSSLDRGNLFIKN